MRIFSFIPALAALVTAVVAATVPADGCDGTSELGCATPVAPKRNFLPSRNGRGLTNAELLRRGLPLNGPVLRRGTPVRRTTPSSGPLPPKTTTFTGVIEVFDPNNNLLGYISENLINGAQYGIDPSIANALDVTFQANPTGSTSQIDISAINSNPAWPYLGLVQGRDDADYNLSPNSYQYLYIGGVDNPGTQPGDTPQSISNSYFNGSPRTAETSVWTFDADNGSLMPEWINTDGSTPAQQLFTQSNALYSSGNPDAFHARYPAPVTLLTLVFLPN